MNSASLILHDIYKEGYLKQISDGLNYIKNKKIVLVGLCRSIENVIENNINIIQNIFDNKCEKFNIVLFENDSKDNTKLKLDNLKQKYNNIDVLSQTYNRPQFGTVKDKNRTIALAEYRNILKNYVANCFSDYDFVIVFDTDFKQIETNGIYNSFGWFSQNKSIGGLSGNSFELKYLSPEQNQLMIWNYDCWAYRGTWWHDWEFQPSTSNEYNQMLWFGFWILPIGSPLVKVNSAFGGMTIYKTKYYLSGTYSGEDCEHVTFHHSILNNNPEFELFLNPSQTMLV